MLTWAVSFAVVYGGVGDGFFLVSMFCDAIIMLFIVAAWSGRRE